MPGKDQGASLTVSQYSQLVLEKYIRHQFSRDRQQNLRVAAEELYVLLHRLRGAASKDSDDSKAPLKAVRNAIDHFVFHGARGADSPEVEALMQLYAALQEICEQHTVGGGSEREGAVQVQDALRYRMTRLVTGDAWDSRPQLKLRILKLMFRFMAREDARLLASSRGLGPQAGESPLRRISRQGSSKRVVAASTSNRWGEAINEVGKMQGSRMLPLLKLAMLENMELSEAAAASPPAAPTTPATAIGAKAPSETAASAFGDRAEDAADRPQTSRTATPAAPSPAASEGTGSTIGSAMKPPASAGATTPPAPPSTPAQPGQGRGSPAASTTEPTEQQRVHVQPVQAKQVPALAGVDDLLGLFDEPPPQEEREWPSQAPPSVATDVPGDQLFAAFDNINISSSPTTTPTDISRGSGNPFLSPRGMPIPDPQPARQEAMASWQYGTGNAPPFHAAAGQGGYSAPTAGNIGGWGFLQTQSVADEAELSGSTKEPASPYMGRTNLFGDTRFSDIAPPLQVTTALLLWHHNKYTCIIAIQKGLMPSSKNLLQLLPKAAGSSPISPAFTTCGSSNACHVIPRIPSRAVKGGVLRRVKARNRHGVAPATQSNLTHEKQLRSTLSCKSGA